MGKEFRIAFGCLATLKIRAHFSHAVQATKLSSPNQASSSHLASGGGMDNLFFNLILGYHAESMLDNIEYIGVLELWWRLGAERHWFLLSFFLSNKP